MAAVGSIDAGQSPTAEPAPAVRPCLDHVVTEDDTPADNMFSEKQQRLLTDPLYSSWQPGQMFLATCNVGLFYAVRQPPLAPDVLVSLDLEVPGDWLAKEHRSYFLWEFGKAPEAVVEIVSNSEGAETTEKMLKYAQIGILYYAIHDPAGAVQPEPLRVFVLRDKSYVPCSAQWLPVLGLGLTLWRGRSRIGTPSGCVGAISRVESSRRAPNAPSGNANAPTRNANAPTGNACGRNS
jgi:Uma2 family endonuclease